MKPLVLILSLLALALTIVPPILFMTGSMETGAMKSTMLVATILWFVTWPVASRESDSEPGGGPDPSP